MALDFPGGAATDRVNVPNYAAVQSLNTLSLAIWVLQRGTGGGAYGRIAEKADASALNGYTWFNEGALPRITFGANRWETTLGQWYYARPSLNTWHHHLLTYDYGATSNDPVFYVDGSVVTTNDVATPAGTLGADTYALDIGNRGSAYNRCWDGALAHYAMWNRILTAYEAKMVYYWGPEAVPRGRVAWLRLLGGVPERNLADGGNIGTVTGTTVTAARLPTQPPFVQGTVARAPVGLGIPIAMHHYQHQLD